MKDRWGGDDPQWGHMGGMCLFPEREKIEGDNQGQKKKNKSQKWVTCKLLSNSKVQLSVNFASGYIASARVKQLLHILCMFTNVNQAFMYTNRQRAENRHTYPLHHTAPGTLTFPLNTAMVCGRMNNHTSVRHSKLKRGRRARRRTFPAWAHVLLWKTQNHRTDTGQHGRKHQCGAPVK